MVDRDVNKLNLLLLSILSLIGVGAFFSIMSLSANDELSVESVFFF